MVVLFADLLVTPLLYRRNLVRTPQLRTRNRCARIAARLQHLLYVSTAQRVLLPDRMASTLRSLRSGSALVGIVDSEEGRTHMMREHRSLILWPNLLALALLAAACSDQTNLNTALKRPSFWVGGEHPCTPRKWTGGGRIDPPTAIDPDPADRAPGTTPVGTTPINGKVTFGFNVFIGVVNGDCIVTKGEIQVVHHPSKTRWHVSIHDNADDAGETVFAFTYNSGQCVVVYNPSTGITARVNGQQGSEQVRMSACDKGEPGSSPGYGPDSFRWEAMRTASTPGTAPGGSTNATRGDTDQNLLTGGNIQAH